MTTHDHLVEPSPTRRRTGSILAAVIALLALVLVAPGPAQAAEERIDAVNLALPPAVASTLDSNGVLTAVVNPATRTYGNGTSISFPAGAWTDPRTLPLSGGLVIYSSRGSVVLGDFRLEQTSDSTLALTALDQSTGQRILVVSTLLSSGVSVTGGAFAEQFNTVIGAPVLATWPTPSNIAFGVHHCTC
jgi:hypothetical protein